MLQGDGGQLGRPAAEGLQGHIDPRQQHAAHVVALGVDDADGGGGAHVNGDNGRLEALQCRHGVRHDIRSYLHLVLHPQVQPRPHAGTHHHGGLAQKPGQGLGHHEIQGGHYAAEDGACDILIVIVIKRKQVHQINADLIGGLTAVGVQVSQEPEILFPVEQSHRGGGVAHVDGQQHAASPLSLSLRRFFYGITSSPPLQVPPPSGILAISTRKAGCICLPPPSPLPWGP